MMRHLLTLIAVGVLVPGVVKAQDSVTLKATVSETVTLSTPESIGNNGNTVRITLPISDSPVIRVPLIVRSNIGFKITAQVESQTAVLSELSVADVRATGRLVSPQIVNALQVKQQLDPDVSQPLFVVSGPRVSLGGTLNSPGNAVQITVLIRLKEPTLEPVQVTFIANKQL
jgi:hypothetical protein